MLSRLCPRSSRPRRPIMAIQTLLLTTWLGSITAGALGQCSWGTNPILTTTCPTVGVGTTTPPAGQRLFVLGGLSVAYSNSIYSPIATDSAGTLAINGWQNVNIQTGSTSRIFVQGATGNIGLSNATPAYRLHINGEASTGRAIGFIGADRTWAIGQGGSEFPQGGIGFRDMFSNATRMVINQVGNVGIGTTNPTSKLHIYGNTGADIRLEDAAVANAAWRILPQTGNTTKAFRIFDATAGLDRLYIDASGNVGIGTPATASKLHLYNGSMFTEATIQGVFNGDTGLRLKDSIREWKIGINITRDNVGGFNIYDLSATPGTGHRFAISTAGNVGIGTTAPTAKLHVMGNATVSGALSAGSFAATYQDLAEWVPAGSRILPGTVVVIDPDRSGEVRAGSLAYDTRVAGVVSVKPGIILGEAGEGKVMVATTGRVKVKVDASRGAIRIGDLLVTSEREGMAMRSEPIVVAGTKIHRPGTLIGKALEPLLEGQGEILVLLSLQ